MAPQIVDRLIVQRHAQHGAVGICRAIPTLNQAVVVIVGIELIATLVIPRGERQFQLAAEVQRAVLIDRGVAIAVLFVAATGNIVSVGLQMAGAHTNIIIARGMAHSDTRPVGRKATGL